MRAGSLARRFLESLPLALVLFIFWIVLTAKFNWHHLLLGAVVSLLLSWLLAKTILANSITLTPGTATIEIDGSRFYIHCLAEAFTEDPGSGTLQRMTAWLVGEGPAEMRKLR